ncbi:MAG: zinc ABC transporter substrate-binding protein, partial [Clostridiaceae bacterium]|nr:zinc ABC transporter substrate-binding protein [Clostridiaceae bacterium]
AAETGAVVYTLDPVVTGEAVPGARDAYLEAMRRNLETLKKALG